MIKFLCQQFLATMDLDSCGSDSCVSLCYDLFSKELPCSFRKNRRRRSQWNSELRGKHFWKHRKWCHMYTKYDVLVHHQWHHIVSGNVSYPTLDLSDMSDLCGLIPNFYHSFSKSSLVNAFWIAKSKQGWLHYYWIQFHLACQPYLESKFLLLKIAIVATREKHLVILVPI